MPRWVKIGLIVAAVAVALLIIGLLGGHGPSRHTSAGDHSAAGAPWR